MSRGWKCLARYAENENFEPADICNAAVQALESDWRDGIPTDIVEGVRRAFLTQQGDLFAKEASDRLEALQRESAGYPMARLLLDCAAANLGREGSAEDSLALAGANALKTRASRGVRSVEEHYLREGPAAQAREMRARLEQACRDAPIAALARELLNIGPGLPKASRKHDDLDDGVPL